MSYIPFFSSTAWTAFCVFKAFANLLSFTIKNHLTTNFLIFETSFFFFNHVI